MAREKDLDSYCVYMHINKINGKKYIGITKQSPEKRWRKGGGYSGKHFSSAIKKYGWDNFEHVILFIGLSCQEACDIEESLITMYHTSNQDYGYNLSSGGENPSKGARWKLSKETRKKMSEVAKGEKNGFYGKHFTEEQLKMLKEKVSGENNGFYGKHHSEKTKDKIRESLKKHRDLCGTGGKKVYCIETHKVYNNQRECAKDLGVSPSLICSILNGRRKQIKGYTIERR